MLRVCFVLVLAQASATSTARAQPIQEQAQRPPPLPPLPECEIWKGTVSGNDPSVEVTARICPVPGSPSRIQGLFQWSSLTSGWNRRELAGEWQEGRTRLVMRDVRVAEERPQPGWRFCVVDRYDLRRTDATHLAGRYDSAACDDHASVTLALEGTAAAPPAPTPPPVLAVPPPPVAPPSVGMGGCGCRAASAPAASPILLCGLLLCGCALLRRRRRGALTRGLAIATALAVGAIGCGDDDAPAPDAGRDAGPRDAGPPPVECPDDAPFEAPAADPVGGPCAVALIPSGFGFRFESRSHRIARLEAYPRIGPEHSAEECPVTTGLNGAAFAGALDGLDALLPLPPRDGGVPDAGVPTEEALVRLEYQVVGPSPRAAPVPDAGPIDAGSVDAGPLPRAPVRWIRGQVPIALGAPRDGGVTASVPVRVNLAAAGLADATTFVALIDGLEIRADVPQDPDYPAEWVPAFGYAVRTFGAAVTAPVRTGDDLELEASLRFDPGAASPEAMNRAAAVARLAAVLHWQVIALDGAVTTADTTLSARCAPAAGEGVVSLAGHPEHDAAAVALTAFTIRIHPAETGSPDPGDFVRTLALALRDLDRDPTTGATTVGLHAVAENGGPVSARLLDYTVDASIALLEWTGPGVAVHSVDLPASATPTELPLEW